MRIIIVGPACSGKDFLANHLISIGLNKSITYTTRPIRDKEVDGIDYHFINISTFNKMKNTIKFHEYDEFNGWHYGSSIDDFNTKNLFIKTPNGIYKLNEDDRMNSYVMYLNISESVVKERLLKRNDSNDSNIRRLESDRLQFKNFKNYDLEITDKNYNLSTLESIVKYWVNDKYKDNII